MKKEDLIFQAKNNFISFVVKKLEETLKEK